MKYRVGRKSKRAILEVETGHEYLVFPQGQERAAEEYCEYLNEGKMTERKFFFTMLMSVASIVLMAMLFSAFIVREKKEKEEWKRKALERAVVIRESSGDLDSVHTSLPICKEK